jgi:hypothetical protein
LVGAQERRRLSRLLRFAMDTSLELNGRPMLSSHGFADTIPEPWHETRAASVNLLSTVDSRAPRADAHSAKALGG